MNAIKYLSLFAAIATAILLISGCGTQATPTPPALATPFPPTGPRPAATAGLTAQGRTELALSLIERRPGEVLARVNGDEIAWDEYETALRQRLFSINSQSQVNWTDLAMQQRLKQVQNEALKDATERALLRQIAQSQGIAVDPAVLEAQTEGEKEKIVSSGRYSSWEAFLQENGLTEETFRGMIADTLLLNALLAAQDVEREAEQVHLRHITVATQALAAEVLAKAQAGEDFSRLAAQYSLDEETKNNAGDLGWFLPDSVVAELKNLALTLPPGGVGGPISTRGGYAIVQVVERGMHELEPVSLRQVQHQAVMVLLEEARAQAQIEYLVDFTATPAP